MAWSVPALSRSSASSRRARERLPWWAATFSSPSRSARACEARSASCGCSRRRAWCGARGRAPRAGRRSRPTAPSRPPTTSSSAGISTTRSRARPRPTSTIAQSATPRRTRPAPTRKRATSSTGLTVAESPMRCGAARAERLEPLEREREVAAALVAGDRVDLVDDHLAHGGEGPAPLLAREQQVERLGGGDEHVGRPLQHGLAARGRGVAGAHRGADGGEAQPAPPGRPPAARRAARAGSSRCRSRAPSAARRRGCASRRGALAVEPLAEERVEAGEEGGEGLARAGGGGDQHVAPGLDLRPARRLRLGGGAEAGLEPARDQRVEAGEHGTDLSRGGAGCRAPAVVDRRPGERRSRGGSAVRRVVHAARWSVRWRRSETSQPSHPHPGQTLARKFTRVNSKRRGRWLSPHREAGEAEGLRAKPPATR